MAYMHALFPPMKVMLHAIKSASFRTDGRVCAQVRVNPWNSGVSNSLRKRRKPSLRLPLISVRPPYFGVYIRGQERGDDLGVLGERDFSNLLAIQPFDGL